MIAEIKNNRYYYAVIITIIFLLTIVNYDANLMAGILPYYYNFADFFKNGFEFGRPFTNNIYTWPMWGYGLVLLLNKKINIIILQQIVTFFTIACVLKSYRFRISEGRHRAISVIICLSFSWFLFHVSLWPYSFSANLLTLSALYFSEGLERKKIKKIVFSSLMYGCMLNFRSDYFYLTFVLWFVFLLVAVKLKSAFIIRAISIWVTVVLVCLIPWCVYTYKYSGRISFVSTNSGHVLFIGLGQLPDNKWGITPSDTDDLMMSIVKTQISTNESSLSSKSDLVLKREFIKMVKSNPEEFFKKCISNLKHLLLNPFYIGDVHKRYLDEKEFSDLKFAFRNGDVRATINLLDRLLNPGVCFSGLVYFLNLFILVCFFISMFHMLTRVFYSLTGLYDSVVFGSIIFYQAALNIVAYNLPVYSTNVFLVVVIFIGLNINSADRFNIVLPRVRRLFRAHNP